VVLDSQPTADVTITADPDSQTELGAGPDLPVVLTFTPVNWDTPQTATVTAVADGVPEGPHTSTITHDATSADSNYDGIAINDVVVSVRDRAGVTITESDGSTGVSEEGPTADTYTIVLNSPPAADVTIFVDPDGQLDVGAGPAVAIVLTFTPANWNTAQTITATAVDDAVVEGLHNSTITHFATSSDPEYHGISISNVVAEVTDNDHPPPAGGGGSSRPVLSARDQNVSTDEDTAVDITLLASGPLGSAPTYFIVSGPANGTLIGIPPDLTYTPNPDFFGSDSFVFIVANGDTTSDLGTVSIDVMPVEDAPRGLAQEIVVEPGETVDILLYGFDPDEGDTVAFEIVELPAHGTLAGTPPHLTYTPDASFGGTDTLTYVVDDGTRTSAPMIVTIVITEPPDEDSEDDSGDETDDDFDDAPVTDAVGPLIADAGEDLQASVGQSVSFDGSRSHIGPGEPTASAQIDVQIVLYTWDFDASDGVGVDAIGPRVDWVYSVPGDYKVTLVVFDTLGRQSQDNVACKVTETSWSTVTEEDEGTDTSAPRRGPQLCGVLGYANAFLVAVGLMVLRTGRGPRRPTRR
jgi:hypothetical protein